VSRLPQIVSGQGIRYGLDPYLDAWVLHFMTENNLEHLMNPTLNAPPEQLRFMAVLDEDQVFVPCSDEMLGLLIRPRMERGLKDAYLTCWRVLYRLTTTHIADPYLKRKILQFGRHRLHLAMGAHILIPSRLMKRLASIFLTRSGLDDPYRELKVRHNRIIWDFVTGPVMDRLVNICPEDKVACRRLDELRRELDLLEIRRLFMLSASNDLWHPNPPGADELARRLTDACPGFDTLDTLLDASRGGKKILYLPNSSGGVVFDLMIIRRLLRMGHQVMLALKEGFYFQTPTIWDADSDPILARLLAEGHLLQNSRASKNELLHALSEHRFVILSDGTRERLNLSRVSVTFARAWKEADLIVAKGEPHHRRLIGSGYQFTRDIVCFHRDENGAFHLDFKPKPESVRKFTESDIRAMADEIIHAMREAKQAGKSVIFYSAVVGSIPGQTKTAIKLLETTAAYLRSRFENAFVINPAEHFVPGMDGDDLMYMWERVQRSGLINVWRFQTYADIEKSFVIMGQKVPPVWVGKDSTFSTGCTKEMQIAVDMQRRHPEMQIIGPDREKFFRRREYGVGRYFDASIDSAGDH